MDKKDKKVDVPENTDGEVSDAEFGEFFDAALNDATLNDKPNGDGQDEAAKLLADKAVADKAAADKAAADAAALENKPAEESPEELALKKTVKGLLKEGKKLEELGDAEKAMAEKILARRAEKEELKEQERTEKAEQKAAAKVERERKEVERIAAVAREIAGPKPVESVQQTGPTPEQLKLVEDEDKVLAEFAKNWEDHDKVAKIRERRILLGVEQIFREIIAPIAQQLPAIQGSMQEMSGEKMIDTVSKAHPDAVDLMNTGKVDKWINSLPSYLRPGLNSVLENGTPEQVIELFDDFKEATGIEKPNSKSAAEITAEKIIAEKAAADKAEADAAARAAQNRKVEDNPRVLSMVGVRAQRTGVAASIDPTDFDGAFAEAVDKVV